jgi:hypothetical protein
VKRLKLSWSQMKTVAVVLVAWFVSHGTALAEKALQPAAKAAEGGGGSYILAYALVLLGVGLGLLFVCRASVRRDRAGPEHYDASKAI